jgi:3-keto-5-aminohexanoate cleavage enzyme
MSVVITVAPTGPIATKADNPALPTSPEEIATVVEQAYHAGAAVAHIHLRDENERPTADLNIARRAMDLIRERCPILIQMSTGVGLSVPFEEREKLVELRPRMATLNPCSMSFADAEFRNPPKDVRRLAARMQELDVKPELEIYDTGHLEVCLQLREEDLLDEPGAGLEDTLYLRKGELASGNRPLVERAVQLARDLDRPVASVTETEALLRLPPAG